MWIVLAATPLTAARTVSHLRLMRPLALLSITYSGSPKGRVSVVMQEKSVATTATTLPQGLPQGPLRPNLRPNLRLFADIEWLPRHTSNAGVLRRPGVRTACPAPSAAAPSPLKTSSSTPTPVPPALSGRASHRESGNVSSHAHAHGHGHGHGHRHAHAHAHPHAHVHEHAHSHAHAHGHALRLLTSQARPGAHSLRVRPPPLGGAAAWLKRPGSRQPMRPPAAQAQGCHLGPKR